MGRVEDNAPDINAGTDRFTPAYCTISLPRSARNVEPLECRARLQWPELTKATARRSVSGDSPHYGIRPRTLAQASPRYS